METMQTIRVYLKHTSAQTSRVVITDHTVWDLNKFLSSQQDEQRKLRAANKEYDVITVATEAEYREQKWQKKQ